MKKAQTFSLDAMIATWIFISVIITFFIILNMSSKPNEPEKLKDEGETIAGILISSRAAGNQNIIVEEKVDEGKLKELSNKSYESLKKELGIEGEFYIHFEDKDGNIIYIDEEENITGIGSDEVNITEE